MPVRSKIGVSIGPGLTTLTRMPRSTSSAAIVRPNGPEAQDALARRHHAPGDVAAGVHAATRRPGAEAALASDPLPRRAGTERKDARAGGAASAGRQKSEAVPPATCEADSAHHRPVRLSWASQPLRRCSSRTRHAKPRHRARARRARSAPGLNALPARQSRARAVAGETSGARRATAADRFRQQP